MSTHVNIETDERTVPYYVDYTDGKIHGFFGAFRFLSNFYPCKNGVVFEELHYPSVEHAYQAAKYPNHLRHQFVDISAAQAKRLGKVAPDFNANRWNKKKYDLMYDLNWQKYQNNPILMEKLILTVGCNLSERNSWGDRDWGTDEQGVGENNLGKILMRIREKLIAMRKNTEW
jgi:ribA/ribD-fused uncharacterized protein